MFLCPPADNDDVAAKRLFWKFGQATEEFGVSAHDESHKVKNDLFFSLLEIWDSDSLLQLQNRPVIDEANLPVMRLQVILPCGH